MNREHRIPLMVGCVSSEDDMVIWCESCDAVVLLRMAAAAPRNPKTFFWQKIKAGPFE